MILLKKVRLVNWYAFNNNTFPVGDFTLIMGRNGAGKSVILDAIRYGAFGDTVFNKSTDTPGKRTLYSYSRGFIDATSNTYMRPPEKIKTVITHIVLEFADTLHGTSFILGTVVESDNKNSTKTYRYVMENKSLDSIEHVYKEDGVVKPMTRDMLKKQYKVTMMPNEAGIERFMQLTGMNMNTIQTKSFLKKIHGILTYNPKSRIEQFIKESVLEAKEIRFDSLVQSMEKIDALNQELTKIGKEIEDLECVTNAVADHEACAAEILKDDIKNAYKDYLSIDDEITELSKKQASASAQIKSIQENMRKKTEEEREIERRIRQMNLSLDNMDCMEPIRMEEEHLEKVREEATKARDEKVKLEHFQTTVSEAMALLQTNNVKVHDQEILASLCTKQYSSLEKVQAVTKLQETLSSYADYMIAESTKTNTESEDNSKKISAVSAFVNDCARKQNALSQVPRVYINLKDEINAAFKRKGLRAEAKFACEYVSGLKNEEWRNTLEAFLGARRYTILVDPEHYDLAFSVFAASANRGAHLFNTKLLMKKTFSVDEKSAVHLLNIQGQVAKKYFEYLLGRMKALTTEEVKHEENALSKDGCVSVSMDTYFLQFDRTKSFLLGQEVFELNKLKAEHELEMLLAVRDQLLVKKRTMEETKNDIRRYTRMFGEFDYDANAHYTEAIDKLRKSQESLESLKRAQKNNKDFIRMEEERDRLDKELVAIRDEKQNLYTQISSIEAKIAVWGDKVDDKTEQLYKAEEKMDAYEELYPVETTCAKEEFDTGLENRKRASELILSRAEREALVSRLNDAEDRVKQGQYNYNANWAMDNVLPIGTDKCQAYEERKKKIWMEDLQLVKEKLSLQKEKYESDFRTEFVLRIYTACIESQREIKRMNHKLAKLTFKEKYQFEIEFRDDGSDYSKIIEYAKYVTETSNTSMNGQISMNYTAEQIEEMEKDIKDIVRRLIESGKEERIAQISDYRNYMSYDILMTSAVFNNARLSKQTSYESGAEVQIPYMLILLSALLITYDARENCAKLVFIDEPFAKMDPGNVKLMLDFMKEHKLQMMFCAPDKVDLIGNECEVVLPILKVRSDVMKIGSIRFHTDKRYKV